MRLDVKVRKVWTFEKNEEPGSVSSLWAIFVLLICISLFCLSHLRFNSLPTPLSRSDENSESNQFIAERAHDYLQGITELGPRVAGSTENEINAINYLLRQLSAISDERNRVHDIDIDVQQSNGSLYLAYKTYGMSSIYHGVKNIIVRLRPSISSHQPENAILINSHFDSVPSSPGAGDDGSMVAVMLEVLRLMSVSSTTFRHSVIFLFNGCEENTLQGSHGFITNHPWAKDVRTFLNCDASGNGGREILFQSHPKNPWLIDYYKKYAPHPYTSVMGEELFQAEVIPSDTDFRIFRDYGKIPGMDFAYNTNGYVYHTRWDLPGLVPNGTLQHTGDNIYHVLKALSNADELENIKKYEGDKVIYFDFMNWFIISYTQTVGIIINTVVIFCALLFIIVSLRFLAEDISMTKTEIAYEFGMTLIIQSLSIGLGVGLTILCALFYDAIGKSMTWFNSSFLIFGLYFCPFYFGMTIGLTIYTRWKMKKMLLLRLSHQTQMLLHTQCIFFILVVIIGTGMAIRSSFMVMIPVFFYSISTLFNLIFKLHRRDFLWLIPHFVGQIIPFLFYSTWTVIAFATFIPLAGRSGSDSNPEMMIALFSILMALLLGGLIVPLICLCKNSMIVSLSFLVIMVVNIILMVTPIGFPYVHKEASQRYTVFHVNRRFHSLSGLVRREEAGYFISPNDRNSPTSIDDIVVNMTIAINNEEICETEFYCGLPFYFNTHHGSAKQSIWIPAEEPVFPHRLVQLNLTKTELISSNQKRYHFTLSGPDHMGIFISPMTHVRLTKWSFMNMIPPSSKPWHDRDVHFISFVGIYNEWENSEYDFWLEIQSKGVESENVANFDIAIAGHYMHYDEARTKRFNEFLESFPDWTVVTAWISSYDGWQF